MIRESLAAYLNTPPRCPTPSSFGSKIVCGKRFVKRWNKDIKGSDSHLQKIAIDQ